MDIDEFYSLNLSFHLDGASPGTDNDSNNPLSRATRSPFIDGRPQQKLSLCFYRESFEDENKLNQNLRWFGVFVLSNAGRLIFFPGFNFEPTWVKSAKKNSAQKLHDIHIDHITLEKNLHSWHYSSAGSECHLGNGFTVDLGESRFLWFGMSIVDINVLRPVREYTSNQFIVPSSDAKRRTDVFIRSRENSVFNIVELHADAKQRFDMGFLHFGLIVGPSGFRDYSGPNFGIPFGSPFVTEALPNPLANIPLRLHRVSIPSKIDIEIAALWLPGSLATQVTYTSPSSM